MSDRYDKDDIPAKIMTEIRKKYVTDARFTPEAAEKASKAAAGLCKWVYAMETYDRVAKVCVICDNRSTTAAGVFLIKCLK